jgi:hypothetical protein
VALLEQGVPVANVIQRPGTAGRTVAYQLQRHLLQRAQGAVLPRVPPPKLYGRVAKVTRKITPQARMFLRLAPELQMGITLKELCSLLLRHFRIRASRSTVQKELIEVCPSPPLGSTCMDRLLLHQGRSCVATAGGVPTHSPELRRVVADEAVPQAGGEDAQGSALTGQHPVDASVPNVPASDPRAGHRVH